MAMDRWRGNQRVWGKWKLLVRKEELKKIQAVVLTPPRPLLAWPLWNMWSLPWRSGPGRHPWERSSGANYLKATHTSTGGALYTDPSLVPIPHSSTPLNRVTRFPLCQMSPTATVQTPSRAPTMVSGGAQLRYVELNGAHRTSSLRNICKPLSHRRLWLISSHCGLMTLPQPPPTSNTLTL